MEIKADKQPKWYRRTIYMLIAIVISALLPKFPVFSFQEDKGIIYIRSFSMDAETFYVTQTELATGAEEVESTMSVKGLYFCAKAMYAVCILALLCFFKDRWRMALCVIAATLAGVYYLLMVYYAIKITDYFYTTLYPNFAAIMPAVVLQLMLLARRDVAYHMMSLNEDEEKGDEPKD